ncbi:hypothetical protein KAFR_0G03430 [Kazachstania africana CBS 2517]|uniref:Uncharacterized protein n=1 Tax=Kazachstania africana (strain ATCC 22294 / BCRC 22015 / CBS 2517 / CECT 1963 / NBRC 1671 / NRRL Y-8276) TaxID=1071382 RepID=H2AYC5_KAZAF|nr:hypothetical protein KAFR_0G03430 [Kazachstania africana CBS 2517]CCF59375.1 hypothetical protein KAFR_0G03430 [Kazachstania africana CBS 2517]
MSKNEIKNKLTLELMNSIKKPISQVVDFLSEAIVIYLYTENESVSLKSIAPLLIQVKEIINSKNSKVEKYDKILNYFIGIMNKINELEEGEISKLNNLINFDNVFEPLLKSFKLLNYLLKSLDNFKIVRDMLIFEEKDTLNLIKNFIKFNERWYKRLILNSFSFKEFLLNRC